MNEIVVQLSNRKFLKFISTFYNKQNNKNIQLKFVKNMIYVFK